MAASASRGASRAIADDAAVSASIHQGARDPRAVITATPRPTRTKSVTGRPVGSALATVATRPATAAITATIAASRRRVDASPSVELPPGSAGGGHVTSGRRSAVPRDVRPSWSTAVILRLLSPIEYAIVPVVNDREGPNPHRVTSDWRVGVVPRVAELTYSVRCVRRRRSHWYSLTSARRTIRRAR